MKTSKLKLRDPSSKLNRLLWVTIFTLYLVFIMLSATAFYAEQTENKTRSRGTHNYTLVYKRDGKIEHYTVERTDPDEYGIINVRYDFSTHTNHLSVSTTNIKKLTIDCESIAREKTKEILGKEFDANPNLYKQHFIENTVFSVSVIADHSIDITFDHVPYPTSVTVKKENENREEVDFDFNDGQIKTLVEEGSSAVEINFGDETNDLEADFITDNKDFFHVPGETVKFDASISDGDIRDYIWDFGDGSYGTGVKPEHTYINDNDYYVILIVRDNNGNIDRKTETLYVKDTDSDELPDEWEEKYFGGISAGSTRDDDKDGLNNRQEYLANTNPVMDDTDGDGINDKDEIDKGYDPLDPKSTPPEEDDDDKGILGMGKFMGIDLFYLIIIFVIIIIIALVSVGRRGKAEEEIEEEEDTEEVIEEEEDIEEEEEYECPECGAKIFEDQPECSSCGATLEWDEAEDDDEFDEEELPEPVKEVPIKNKEPVEPSTEENEEEETDETDEFECPTCGTSLDENDIKCPVCGEEFED